MAAHTLQLCLMAILALTLFPSPSSGTDNPPPADKLKDFFPLTLIHFNDLHARFDETDPKSKVCTPELHQAHKCIAGFARISTTIKKLKAEYKDKNPIYLNAGDNFQGSLWYNLLRWNVTAYLMKLLPPDAMVLGNHEFDHGPQGLAPYIEQLTKAGIKTTVANLNKNGEPVLAKSEFHKYLILEKAGKKIGVIGVLYDRTHLTAQTGKVFMENAIEVVKKVSKELKDLGVDIIIVLSHCGYDVEQEMAKRAGEHVDAIVGAHTHSFLFPSKSSLPHDLNDNIEGDYPTVVQGPAGNKVLLVQAKSFGKYVGRLTLYFDKKGDVKHWDGYPVYLSNSITPDPAMVKELAPWKAEVERLGTEKIGSTKVFLDRESCREKECTLGILTADAFAAHHSNSTFKPVAIVQAGNFRNPIEVGDITNGDAIEAIPYGSTVDLVKLKGDSLWKAIEHSFTLDDEQRMNVMQLSRLKVVVNLGAPEKVQSIQVQDISGAFYAPLDRQKDYYVAAPSYLVDGKDGFDAMKSGSGRVRGQLDSDVLIQYIKEKKVITEEILQVGRMYISGTLPK